jgi:hypothetical protein
VVGVGAGGGIRRELERDAHRPQRFLIPFEAPAKGLAARLLVTRDALPDVLRSHRVPCFEQRGYEIDEPFDSPHQSRVAKSRVERSLGQGAGCHCHMELLPEARQFGSGARHNSSAATRPAADAPRNSSGVSARDRPMEVTVTPR